MSGGGNGYKGASGNDGLRSGLLPRTSTNISSATTSTSAFEFNDAAHTADGDYVERRIDVFNLRSNPAYANSNSSSTSTSTTYADASSTPPQEYAKNSIITSRYTWYSYLPKTLFEQFRRLANVYFVVIGIIAIVGKLRLFTYIYI